MSLIISNLSKLSCEWCFIYIYILYIMFHGHMSYIIIICFFVSPHSQDFPDIGVSKSSYPEEQLVKVVTLNWIVLKLKPPKTAQFFCLSKTEMPGWGNFFSLLAGCLCRSWRSQQNLRDAHPITKYGPNQYFKWWLQVKSSAFQRWIRRIYTSPYGIRNVYIIYTMFFWKVSHLVILV